MGQIFKINEKYPKYVQYLNQKWRLNNKGPISHTGKCTLSRNVTLKRDCQLCLVLPLFFIGHRQKDVFLYDQDKSSKQVKHCGFANNPQKRQYHRQSF